LKYIFINVDKFFLTKSLLTHLPNGLKETKLTTLEIRESINLKLTKIVTFVVLTTFLGGGTTVEGDYVKEKELKKIEKKDY